MVHRVVVARQDEREPLQEDDDRRRIVRVRPLVELVRAEDPQAEREDEDSREDALPAVEGDERRRERHRRDADEAVVSVGLDEVVAGDRLRIDVVLAEGPDEGAAGDRKIHRSPGIGQPVHDAGDEVRRDEPEHERARGEKRGIQHSASQPEEQPGHRSRIDDDAGDLEPAHGRPVTLPERVPVALLDL